MIGLKLVGLIRMFIFTLNNLDMIIQIQNILQESKNT